MTAITIRTLSKSFRRDRKALNNISLRINEGEMVALIGASGSGKSTLLRHIGGLTAGDRSGEGVVSVLGQDVQRDGRLSGDVRKVRCGMGFIFQQFNLVSRLSLITNVLLGLLGQIPVWRGTFGLFTAQEKRQAMEALNRVGMAPYAAQRASTLSGGQQQRAAIARAMVQKARMVLADEPIASLDPASAGRVMETLAAINREDGITVLVSLHQVDYALKFCPRTIAMRDGEIIFDGPTTRLTPAFLRELYGAESEELLVAAPPDQKWDDDDDRVPLAAAAAAVA